MLLLELKTNFKMKIDRTLNKIIDEVSEKRGIDKSVVTEVIKFSLLQFKKVMALDEMPKILLRGLGKFKASPDKLRAAHIRMGTALKRENVTEEFYEAKKEQYISIIQRRIKEDGERICSKKARLYH